jgi:outer membrane immunogenic protein
MKRFHIAGLGLVSLFAGPVMAADLPTKAPPPKVAPLYNWTGCYAGLHFGSIFEQEGWGAAGGDDETGVMVGGQAGCNYQFSTWVVGVQGEGAWTQINGSHPDQVSPLGLTDDWRTDMLASVTGRFGYAWDRVLFYGRGGPAWTHNEYDTSGSPTATDTRTGYVVGGGFEYGITQHFTMFWEYDYYDFGTKTIDLPPTSYDIRDRNSVVKVGGNWKF